LNKKISIIIVTHTAKEHALNCLNNLFLSAYTYENKEVFVVDNASSYSAELKDTCDKCDYHYIVNDENLAFDLANEIAIKQSTGQYILLLNDDTLPMKDYWLEKYMKFANEHPQAGVIGARLVYPQDDTIQHAGVAFNQYRQPYHIFNKGDVNDPRILQARQFQAVTFACVMIKKECYDQIGGFTHHEKTPAYYYEDIDFCFKARNAGWEVWYNPEVIVHHYSAQSYMQTMKNQQESFKHLPEFIEKWFIEIDHDDWKMLDTPEHNPHIAIGIPLTEGSGWRFDQLMNMIKGFHYWKKNITIIFSITDSGPTFMEKVRTWAKTDGLIFKEVLMPQMADNSQNKMSSVYYNREKIRKIFLEKTDAQYLFFIDSDVAMERTTLRKLIDICEYQGADISAGTYFYKLEDERARPMLFKIAVATDDYKKMTFRGQMKLSSNYPEKNIGLGNFVFAREAMDGGVHQVHASGMGCTLIKRKCLEQIPFKAKPTYGTEDLSWFSDAYDKGYKLLVDTGLKVYHLDPNGYIYCWWQLPTRERDAIWEVTPNKREVVNYGV